MIRVATPLLLCLLLFSNAFSLQLNYPSHHTIFAFTSGLIAINSIGIELADLTIEADEPEAVPGGYERTVTLFFEFEGVTYEILSYREDLPVNVNPQTGAITLIEPLPQPDPNDYVTFPIRNTADGKSFNILLRRQADSLNLEIIEMALEPYKDPDAFRPTSPPVTPPFWYDDQSPFEQVRDINTPQLFHFRNGEDHVIIRFSRYRIHRTDPVVGGNFASVRQVVTERYRGISDGFNDPQEFTRPVSEACLNRKNPLEIYTYYAVKENGSRVRTDLMWIPYNLKYGTGFYLEATAEGPGVTMYSTPSEADSFLRSISPRCRYFGPGE